MGEATMTLSPITDSRKMMKSKRGILYTFGLTLFVLVLLAVSILVFKQSYSANERFTELSGRQKVYDLEQSLEKVFEKILASKTDIKISRGLNFFNINQSLPQNLSNVTAILITISDNVNRDFPFFKLNATLFVQEPKIIFKPSNIEYIPQNNKRIIVKPTDSNSSNNILGYDIILNFNYNITSCTNSNQAGSRLKISVTAISPFGSCIIPSTTLNSVYMDLISEGKNTLILIDNGNSSLSLQSDNNIKTSINVLITPLTEEGYFEWPITETVNETSISLTKITNVRID